MNIPHKSVTGSLAAALFAISLVATGMSGCGGGDDAVNAAPAGMIGPAGGTVSGPNGAQVVIPAGALAANTAIAITLAPGILTLPAGNATVGPVFSFTPHGQTFAQGVTITVPIDPAQVPAGAAVKLHKTMNGAAGPWQEVAGATRTGNLISGQVTSFSDLAPTISMSTPIDQAVVAPAAATFTVNAIGGSPPYTYQWEKSDDGGMTFSPAPGATNSNTYTTGPTSVATDDADRYQVKIISSDTDGNGILDGSATSRVARLTVTAALVAPAFTTQPMSQTVAAGASATFSVVAAGTDLVYQWQKNGAPIAGQTNASLNLVNVQAADAASYTVVVSNLVGGIPVNSVTSSPATLALSAPPAGAAARISAGDFFSVAVNATGVPSTWGVSGVLGNGSTVDRPTAAPVGGFNAVRSVAGGNIAAMAIRTDGTLWAWGYRGSIDCLFGGTAPTPYQIAGAANVASVSMGASHSLLLGSDGVVRALGCNFQGELGRAGTAPAMTPVAVAGLPAGITAVAAGGVLSLALDGAGNVWAWGQGALGNGTPLATSRFTPVQVAGLTGVTAIAAGEGYALALKSDGSVWAWGGNVNGRLGDGTIVDRLGPVATLLTSQITAIVAGDQNGLALRSDGVVLSWGINETGQLGSGSSSPGFRPQPAPVINLTGVVAIDFGSGGALGHGMALKSDGTVWSWGWNSNGQLGNGTTASSTSPVQVTGLNLN